MARCLGLQPVSEPVYAMRRAFRPRSTCQSIRKGGMVGMFRRLIAGQAPRRVRPCLGPAIRAADAGVRKQQLRVIKPARNDRGSMRQLETPYAELDLLGLSSLFKSHTVRTPSPYSAIVGSRSSPSRLQ